MDELKQYVIEKLEEASGIENVTDTSRLFEDEILNSLSILYLVSELEEQYSIQIPLEDIIEDNFCDVNHIVMYLQEKIEIR